MSLTPPRNPESARANEDSDDPSPSTQRARGEQARPRTTDVESAGDRSSTGPERASETALRDTHSDQPAFALDSDARDDRPDARPKAGSAGRSTPEDTLLSLPAPADGRDVEVDDRLSELGRRLDELASRVRVLERAPAPAANAAPSRGNQWLIWVIFLLTLALAWQIVRTSR